MIGGLSNASFPRYPDYKDSGVEWLGEVPAHWGIGHSKHLAEFVNGDAFKPTEWATFWNSHHQS